MSFWWSCQGGLGKKAAARSSQQGAGPPPLELPPFPSPFLLQIRPRLLSGLLDQPSECPGTQFTSLQGSQKDH